MSPGLPRACGGDPLRTWDRIDARLVFPPHAGVIPCQSDKPHQEGCLPRACGGDPDGVDPSVTVGVSSPRMQG